MEGMRKLSKKEFDAQLLFEKILPMKIVGLKRFLNYLSLL